jgi:hypothetical protein
MAYFCLDMAIDTMGWHAVVKTLESMHSNHPPQPYSPGIRLVRMSIEVGFIPSGSSLGKESEVTAFRNERSNQVGGTLTEQL